MTSKKLTIKQLVRTPQFDTDDFLELKPGVNVIVGSPNSGKTKWLSMLDYLMGDDSKPEKAFSLTLAEKYDSVKALVSIGDEDIWIERRWKQYGEQSKIFLNDKPINQKDFSSYWLAQLNIPTLNFPKGNPYEERAWPELSWRIMLRQIYRQQRFWADLVDKQPESERQASLLQFLGIAEHVYSDASGAIVDIRKEIWKLQGAKEQYLAMLDEITREITDEKEFRVALTVDSIDLSISRLQAEIREYEQKRDTILQELREQTLLDTDEQKNNASDYDSLSVKWTTLQAELDENRSKKGNVEKRLAELASYRSSILSELSRLERAKDAGDVLSDLKITHCPACDQSIKPRKTQDGCYLCGQELSKTEDSDSDNRVESEIKRLQEDLKEVNELTQALTRELKTRLSLEREQEDEINQIDYMLQPARRSVASFLPPDISIWNMEIGRRQERIRQLERIKHILDAQKNISSKIDELKQKEENLKGKIHSEGRKVNYEMASDWLTDGMNSYLNALVAQDKKLWTQDQVKAKVREKDFSITVRGQEWSSQLGGTLILYFLIAYHYSLLRLTKFEQCNYPGLTILDLPPTLEDGSTIRDKENFVIEPYINLLKQSGMQNAQVIITGASFENLAGVNRIVLKNTWK